MPHASPLSARLTHAELEAQIAELAGHLNAATHRFLMLIAEFDRREAWGHGDGVTRSCAHWLSWKLGIDIGAAREKMRVAHALEQLPLISGAMARGELSYSKVRAITRVATPATEADLLMIALHGTAQHVERLVRSFRRALEAEVLSREAQQQLNRGVRYFHDDDGSLVLNARLPAEAGAVLVKAIDLAVEALREDALPKDAQARYVSAEMSEGDEEDSFYSHPPRADPPTLAQERADALALFADNFLRHGPRAVSGGDRQQIVIHVDAEALRDTAPGRCEIEDGPSIPVATARRLSCDASLVEITEDGDGNPLDIGRKTRSIPPSIRRALRARDTTCRFPGCHHTRWLDGHHIRHWADGGETRLTNLVMLCRSHHRALHEGGFSLRMLDDGALQFLDARRDVIVAAPALQGDWDALIQEHEHAGLDIDPDTAATRWCGERMDYGMAVGCLVDRHLKAQRVSAGTDRSPVD